MLIRFTTLATDPDSGHAGGVLVAAISWFTPAAEEAIRRMWHLKSLLDRHDHHVEVLRTSDPGTVVYQDAWQVIAKPRKGQRF